MNTQLATSVLGPSMLLVLRAAEAGEALRQLRRWSWGTRAIALVLVIAVWDVVAKPGL
jgi:hypothetical protein